MGISDDPDDADDPQADRSVCTLASVFGADGCDDGCDCDFCSGLRPFLQGGPGFARCTGSDGAGQGRTGKDAETSGCDSGGFRRKLGKPQKEWNQSVESTRAGFVQRRDELVSGIEKRFERAKELLPSGRLNVNREELFDLRSKFGVNLQRPELASFLKDFTKRDMLRGNPSMVSKKFSEALEELKKSAVEYKKREKNKMHALRAFYCQE